MKSIILLSLIAIGIQAVNIRGSAHPLSEDIVLLQSEDLEDVVDLSGNVGVINIEAKVVEAPLTKQQIKLNRAEEKETNAINRAIEHSYTHEIKEAQKKEQAAIHNLIKDSQFSFAQVSQEFVQEEEQTQQEESQQQESQEQEETQQLDSNVDINDMPLEENQTEMMENQNETPDLQNVSLETPAMGNDPIFGDAQEAPMMISVDNDPENSDLMVSTEELQQFQEETQVDALSLIQIKQETTTDVFVEETLDQLAQSEIVDTQDLYTNDGHSPNMGEDPILEDAPSSPMMIIQPDETEYIRDIDQIDLVDDDGQPKANPQDVIAMIQTYEDNDQSLPLFGDDQGETPFMAMDPETQMGGVAQTSETSPGAEELHEMAVERETEELVNALQQEEEQQQEQNEE